MTKGEIVGEKTCVPMRQQRFHPEREVRVHGGKSQGGKKNPREQEERQRLEGDRGDFGTGKILRPLLAGRSRSTEATKRKVKKKKNRGWRVV